jgi:hypothetical protein
VAVAVPVAAVVVAAATLTRSDALIGHQSKFLSKLQLPLFT